MTNWDQLRSINFNVHFFRFFIIWSKKFPSKHMTSAAANNNKNDTAKSGTNFKMLVDDDDKNIFIQQQKNTFSHWFPLCFATRKNKIKNGERGGKKGQCPVRWGSFYWMCVLCLCERWTRRRFFVSFVSHFLMLLTGVKFPTWPWVRQTRIFWRFVVESFHNVETNLTSIHLNSNRNLFNFLRGKSFPSNETEKKALINYIKRQ